MGVLSLIVRKILPTYDWLLVRCMQSLKQILLTRHIPLGPDKVKLPLVSERPPLCVDDDVLRLPMIPVPELYIFNILNIQRLELLNF